MKYLPFIWASLWRKPIRTVFTFVSVVLGFVLLGVALGLHASLRHLAESARADRIYISARFAGKLRLAQLEQISQMPDVSNVAALDAIAGYYRRPGNNAAILMLGPEMRKVFPELSLTAQQWEMLAGARDGVFASKLFAIRYGLRVGSDFPVISSGTPRADGSDVWEFDVLGIVPDIALMPVGFAIGNYDYLDQARAQTDQGEAGQFWILAKDAGHTGEVMNEIDQFFANSSVPTRSVSEKALLESAGGGGSDSVLAITAIAVVGVLMIMFLTANALGHSIRERTAELAVLKTLGFSNVSVVTLVLTEAALPCLFGCFLGLAAAKGAAAAMPFISPAGFVLPPLRIDFEVVSSGIGAALLIALVAAAMPVLRITRLDVAAALARH